nr:MAG TPA: hypothetical protein [Caudoviricetes sp.]
MSVESVLLCYHRDRDKGKHLAKLQGAFCCAKIDQN